MSRRILCLTLPELLTDIVGRALPALRVEPLAVVEARSGGVRVVAANEPARGAGIARGMTLTEARALLPGLVARALPPSAAPGALARLGDWAHRWGPCVGILPPEEQRPPAIAVEVGGSSHLFGGEGSLAARALGALSRAGHGAVAAIAGTLGAAYGIAAYGPSSERPAIVESGGEASALSALPLEALRLPGEAIRRLGRLGIRTVEALSGLPRPSVGRRFGEAVLRRLGEALGEVEEPLPRHRPEMSFRSRIELLEPDDRAETITWTLSRLLEDAASWLLARGEGARRLSATLEAEGGARADVDVACGIPRRDRRRLERLFRARLAAVPAPGRLVAISLAVLETGSLRGRQLEVFSGAPESIPETIEELVERLAARLGERATLRPRLADDPRPERAAASAFATRSARGAGALASSSGGAGLPAAARIAALQAGGARLLPATGGGGSRAPPSPATRPVRLLAPPRPIPPPARVLRGPERIASGWWDGAAPARDYHVVEDDRGRRLWAYLEGGQWRVHGVF